MVLDDEAAFTKAGIPMDDPRIGYFVKGYDGELEPTAIREAAVSAGFIQAPPQTVDPTVQQAREGQERVLVQAFPDVPWTTFLRAEMRSASGTLRSTASF
jgi:hypothetical protein